MLYEDTFLTAPTIADINGDGEPEIIVVSSNSRLYAITFEGEIAGDYPLATGRSNGCPALLVNGEETALAVPSYDGALYLWCGFSSAGGTTWRQFGLNGTNNRMWFYEPSEENASTGEGIVEFYNYPNPVAENTYFRYTVSKTGIAEIRIFDETGNEIALLSGEAHPGIPNEILWTPTGVSSGIYMAVLKLKFADGGTATKKQVIAVLKK